ncbi:MAG: hypothetical protein HC914_21695, partial [Chloroflexaceae bacterium]|nr:hypothetical protein [Chloroflexaceae bacterium]
MYARYRRGAVGRRCRGTRHTYRLAPVAYRLLLLLLLLGACAPATPAPVPVATPTAIKLYILEDGMYEIGEADLPAWNAATLQGATLYHRRHPVPVWIVEDNEGVRLRFYGQASDSRYSRENVYWLQPARTA